MYGRRKQRKHLTKEERKITGYQSKRFSTYTGDLRKLAAWLKENHCFDVCMESTGKYWFPVHNVLEKDFRVVVSHPKFVKAIKGKKTDKKDAMWIADLFKHDLVRGSFIPPEEIRQLRDLCRYYQKLVWNTTGEKNRVQNCLTVSNFKLDDVFSNVFGKSASAIISFMLEHPGETFDVAPFMSKRCKASPQEVQNAVDGAFSLWQAEKLKIIRKHISNLDDLRDALQKLILKLAEPYSRQIELLLTVPGISDHMTAIRVIAEIGADMHQFESSKHLCSWAGLTPQNNESAGKKKTTRIGKAGQYIKPLLLQCAIAASNPRSNFIPKSLPSTKSSKRGVVRKRPELLLPEDCLPQSITFSSITPLISPRIPLPRIPLLNRVSFR